MDDFPTFKKLMVKRNVELQLEALRSFRRKVISKGKSESFHADDADEIWETLLAQENVQYRTRLLFMPTISSSYFLPLRSFLPIMLFILTYLYILLERRLRQTSSR